MGWLEEAGFKFVPLDFKDNKAIQSGRVDVDVFDDSGVNTDYVAVDYDAQSERSAAVASLVAERMDAFPGRPTHALLSAVPNETFTFHLFFEVVFPLLLLASVALGAFVSRRDRMRGKAGLALAYATVFLIAVISLTANVEFPGNDGISTVFAYIPPVLLLPGGLLLALPLSFGLAGSAGLIQKRDLRWAIPPAAFTAIAFLFAAAATFDPTASAWTSNLPGIFLPALCLGGVGTPILARARGVRI
jgi:hypothetical protein